MKDVIQILEQTFDEMPESFGLLCFGRTAFNKFGITQEQWDSINVHQFLIGKAKLVEPLTRQYQKLIKQQTLQILEQTFDSMPESFTKQEFFEAANANGMTQRHWNTDEWFGFFNGRVGLVDPIGHSYVKIQDLQDVNICLNGRILEPDEFCIQGNTISIH